MMSTTMKRIAALAAFAALAVGCATTPQKTGHGLAAFPTFPGTSGGGGGGSGTVTSVTGTAPISVATGTTTPAISIAAATGSNAGSISAADQTKLNSLSSGGWFDSVKATMAAACPSCTSFWYQKAGQYSAGGTPTSPCNDSGSMNGAPVGVANDTVAQVCRFTGLALKTPKSSSWVAAFRGTLPAITSGQFAYFGMSSAANSFIHWVAVSTDNAVSSTKFVLEIKSTDKTTSVASTVNADISIHTFVIGMDTSSTPTARLYIDGSQVATQTTLTQVADELMLLAIWGNAALTPGPQVLEYAWGL